MLRKGIASVTMSLLVRFVIVLNYTRYSLNNTSLSKIHQQHSKPYFGMPRFYPHSILKCMPSIDQFLLEMNQNDGDTKLRNEWYHGIHFLID